ncbi:hypothetical protein [Mesorhizobium sp.]|nr:hypothetical protein [Mesorhizobium sp.]
MTDKFGVYWQVTPQALLQMLGDPDKENASGFFRRCTR